ncbi:RING finger protein [Sporobolomyces koalae]|uniref:RING finger protein n=1 Tax=Sporobolomyces koalae TaxID=500713 RepID=UPI00317E3E2E
MSNTINSDPPIACPSLSSASFPPAQPEPNGSAAPADTPARTRLPPALEVRLGVMRRLGLAASGMDGQRRSRLAFTTFVGAAQVIAFVVILAVSYSKPCDQNLKLYLILLIVRLCLALPGALWSSISPRTTRRDTPERREELERNRIIGNRQVDWRFKKLSDIVSLYGLIVFLLGNIWIISTNTCPATNPVLYRGALAAVILSWLWVLEFFLLCAFAIFCLPILLFGIRHWGWGQKKHEVGPLKKGDMDKLPRRIFTGTLPSEPVVDQEDETKKATDSTVETASVQSTNAPAKTTKKTQWWRLWRSSGGSGTTTHATANPLTLDMYPPFPIKTLPIQLPESQNACAICLSEYELPPLRGTLESSNWKPEILLLLPCGHAFHESCLKDWLAVSGRCALCQAPVFPPKPTKPGKTSAPAAAPTEEPSSTRAEEGPVQVSDTRERARVEDEV